MSRRAIEVLLLDFGGVCLLSPVELHDHLEQRLGLAPGTFGWLGPLDPSTDPLWTDMVAGVGITERGYWHQRAAEVGRAAGRPMALDEYMRLLYEPPRSGLVRADADDVVGRARAAGYGVSVLTNDLRAFHGPEWGRGIPLLQLVDHVVDCSDTGILKPDPRAFQRAVDIIGVPADQVLFVDDQPLNVAGAAAFGMEVQYFDVADAAGSWEQVAERLGL